MKRFGNMPIVFALVTSGSLLIGLFLILNSTSRATRADPGTLFADSAGTGTACIQTAPCDLPTALGQGHDGDLIYVAQGTYTGTGGAIITVTKSISLYGGWDGSALAPVVRDPEAYPTVLDGEGQRRGLYISGPVTPTIDGFIITGGAGSDGGGVYINDASPALCNNVITANHTITSAWSGGRGGGIFVGGASHAVIAENLILSNTAGYGGGVYHIGHTAITITANRIAQNVAAHRAGGILVEDPPDTIQANVIAGNSAASDGGGMLIWDAAPRLQANRMVSNSARVGAGISVGNSASPSLFNNLLISNTRDGLHIASSSAVVVNNTIVGSGLSDSGYGIDLFSSYDCNPPYCTAGSFINNIVISYQIGIFGAGPITPVIDYNDVWGNITRDYLLPSGVVTGAHNISLDPHFANPAGDDYHLRSDSPCIGAGDPAGIPPAPSTDLDSEPRPTGDRVDIGADEYVATIYLSIVLKSCCPPSLP